MKPVCVCGVPHLCSPHVHAFKTTAEATNSKDDNCFGIPYAHLTNNYLYEKREPPSSSAANIAHVSVFLMHYIYYCAKYLVLSRSGFRWRTSQTIFLSTESGIYFQYFVSDKRWRENCEGKVIPCFLSVSLEKRVEKMNKILSAAERVSAGSALRTTHSHKRYKSVHQRTDERWTMTNFHIVLFLSWLRGTDDVEVKIINSNNNPRCNLQQWVSEQAASVENRGLWRACKLTCKHISSCLNIELQKNAYKDPSHLVIPCRMVAASPFYKTNIADSAIGHIITT